MTSREQTAETAARIIWRDDIGDVLAPDEVADFWATTTNADQYRKVAAKVLDAILPQVSTVEELEALPDEVTVLDLSTGDGWQRIPGKRLWGGFGCNDPDRSEYLIEYGAPLTVVWRPE